MKRILLNCLIITAIFSTSIYAQEKNDITKERAQVINHYIQNLQNADYKNMTELFAKDGYVVSTSRGKVAAKEFFYSFLPNIRSATTEFKNSYQSTQNEDQIAARFHFTFELKDGEKGEGEYIDEFLFAKNSVKLNAVTMFENLKWN